MSVTTNRLVITALCYLFSIQPGSYGMEFWKDLLRLPPDPIPSVPTGTSQTIWKGPVNVLGIVQIQDDLGRQQTSELDRLARRNGGNLSVGVYSLDLSEHEWPKQRIINVRRSKHLELPIHFLSPENTGILFSRFEPSRVRVLPQVILFDNQKGLLGILTGVHKAEEIEAAVDEARMAFLPPMPLTKTGGRKKRENLVSNPDFEKWERKPNHHPASWKVTDTSQEGIFKVEKTGVSRSTAVEIRNSTAHSQPMVYQLLPVEKIAGEKIRLESWARSNCIGKPVVVLAGAARRRDPTHRFLPWSPILTKSGKRVPMRILAACDFNKDKGAWQHLVAETTIPDDSPAVGVFLFLENRNAPFGAAYFDNVNVEITE